MKTDQLENIYSKIHEKDYKVTPQRKIILKTILESSNEHLSSEELYNKVKNKNPEIGLATVYRTLDLLVELEVLQKLDFGDGKRRYEFSDHKVHHHHHLICIRCNKVFEFEDDLLDSLENAIMLKVNFKVLDHHLKFYGLCKQCNKS